jgi:hypothetical protein
MSFRGIVRTHNICLSTNGHQTVDVFADRHKDLSSHVTALLRSRRLVLNVDTSSSLLDEKHCKLHDRCQATMSSIRISDNRSEEVSVCELRALGFGDGHALFTLLSVVEELGHEKMANFVRYRGLHHLAKLQNVAARVLTYG